MDLGLAAAQYALFLFSTVCHEAGHAWAAQLGGDDTAARGGQAGLDPLPHIRREPIGMVLAPLLGIFGGGLIIGWASTPYDPRWAAHYPKRAAAMSLAGPLANLALLLLAALAIHAGIGLGLFTEAPAKSLNSLVQGDARGWTQGLATLASLLFSLNLLLFFFNLIPFGPLDGAGAVGLLPGGEKLSAFLSSSRFNLVGLVAAWLLFPYLIRPVFAACLALLFPGSPTR